MKKAIYLVVAVAMCVFLCSCSSNTGSQEGDISTVSKVTSYSTSPTIEKMVGVWHSEEAQQILTVDTNGIAIYKYPSGTFSSMIPPTINNKQLSTQIATFEIDNSGEEMKLICTETSLIAKGTTFTKCEEILSLDEITSHAWINVSNGNSLSFTYESTASFTTNNIIAWIDDTHLAGDTYYIPNVDIFKIVEEGTIYKLVGEKLGEYVVEENYIAPTAPEPEYLSIGDTASTDFANFTLTSLEYVDRLNATTGSGILSRDRGLTDAGLVVGNKIFAVIHFDFTNLAKTEKRVTDVVAVTVDYNNGYLYRTSDGLAYMFDSTGFYNNYSGEGYILDLSPLESDNFKVCVPVAEVVGADTTSPLQIKIELQGDDGTTTFVYVIR